MENSSLSNIKIPINAYDLFGYLIPGLTFVVSSFLFEYYLLHRIDTSTIEGVFHKPFYTLAELVFFNGIADNWILSAFTIIVIICMLYVVGHILSSISSLFIDRILVSKGYGYPYEYLLNFKSVGDAYSSAFYKGVFMWLNTIILLYYIRRCLELNNVAFNIIIGIINYFFIVTILCKILFSWKKMKSIKNELFKRMVHKVKGIISIIYSTPYNAFSSMLSKYLNTRRAFSDEFIEKYKFHFNRNFNLDPNKSESNNYWLSYCYVSTKSPPLNNLITNWLHMYSYSRNISTSFYLSFIYIYSSIIFQNIPIQGEYSDVIYAIPLIYLLLSIIMLIRYYYLYVCYFSKFIFRSFVYLNEIEYNSSELIKNK